MSRELKFRAWDKEKLRWIREYDERLEDLEDQDYEKEYDDDAGWLDGDVASDIDLVNGRLGLNRYVWEQYTGLKDKNGKEIYEGDIVGFYEYYLNEETGEDEPGELKPWGQVTYEDEKARFGIWGDSPYTGEEKHFFGLTGGLEVIGNIHENRELLKENNGED